jgi:phosphorylase kinase alpha/beta subunit
MIIHNQRLASMVRPCYSLQQISEIISFLQQMGTLEFPALANGLFPAAALDQEKSYTGYSYVWVRDNVYVALAHSVVGDTSVAVKTLSMLMRYFSKHRHRFVDIISGKADPANPMNRPQVRFDGSRLEEIDEKWAHAQNDALGYFLWMFCKLVNEGKLRPSHDDMETLTLFPLYFQAIRYWQDEDSGHWEEIRKISASSIGVVMAGLQEFRKLIDADKGAASAGEAVPQSVESLMAEGGAALKSILPAECVQSDPARQRLYDAALLFLIYPLQVVEGQMAERILENTQVRLQGEYGVRRYPRDSYWAPDYKKKLKPSQRTADFSDDLSSRDRLLIDEKQGAQWCIFDPIISCIYGNRFKATPSEANLTKQTEYLNRSLGQITSDEAQGVPPLRCPELYYLEDDRYVPNDHVPLLWTEANLMLGLWAMKESCVRAAQAEHKTVLS